MHFENMNSVVSLLKIEDWETRVFLVRCLWCELLPESLKPETGEPFCAKDCAKSFHHATRSRCVRDSPEIIF